MRHWLAIIFFFCATGGAAQDYGEDNARAVLQACLAGKAADALACQGVVEADCARHMPADEAEFVALSCDEAAFGAWYEALETTLEGAFARLEALEARLYEANVNPDYIRLTRNLSDAQAGWEAYMRAHCAIAPLAAQLQAREGPSDLACASAKMAARVAELRALVAALGQ